MMNVEITKTASGYFGDGDVKDYHSYDIMADGVKVGSMEIIDQFNDYNDVCYVERIDIYEGHRGQGIGTEVLTSKLWDEGYRSVVCAPDNDDAKRLYERIGHEGNSVPGTDYDFDMDGQGYGVYII